MTIEELKAEIAALNEEIKQMQLANKSDKEKADRLLELNRRLAETNETLKNKEDAEESKGLTMQELTEKIKNETATNAEIIRFGIDNAEQLGIDASVLKGETADDKFNNLKETINNEFRKGGME